MVWTFTKRLQKQSMSISGACFVHRHFPPTHVTLSPNSPPVRPEDRIDFEDIGIGYCVNPNCEKMGPATYVIKEILIQDVGAMDFTRQMRQMRARRKMQERKN